MSKTYAEFIYLYAEFFNKFWCMQIFPLFSLYIVYPKYIQVKFEVSHNNKNYYFLKNTIKNLECPILLHVNIYFVILLFLSRLIFRR